MTFPKKHLNEGETIALDMHPHWWYFAEPAFSLAATIVVGIWVIGLEDGTLKDIVRPVLLAVLAGTALWLVYRAATWQTTNFVITSQRVIFRQGLIAKRGMEIPLDRVNNVNFTQGIFERMLGAGDLVIESAGESGRQSFSDVRKPSAVQNEIYRQIEDNENRKFDRIGQGGGSSQLSIADELAKLDELRRSGVLSEDEFAAQKARLLGGH